MCYFCHDLGNNPDAHNHRSKNCEDERNLQGKKNSHRRQNISLSVVLPAVINQVPNENEIRTFSRKTRLHPSTVNVSRNAIIFCQGKWYNIINMIILDNKAKVIYTGDTQGSPEYVTEFFFKIKNN